MDLTVLPLLLLFVVPSNAIKPYPDNSCPLSNHDGNLTEETNQHSLHAPVANFLHEIPPSEESVSNSLVEIPSEESVSNSLLEIPSEEPAEIAPLEEPIINSTYDVCQKDEPSKEACCSNWNLEIHDCTSRSSESTCFVDCFGFFQGKQNDYFPPGMNLLWDSYLTRTYFPVWGEENRSNTFCPPIKYLGPPEGPDFTVDAFNGAQRIMNEYYVWYFNSSIHRLGNVYSIINHSLIVEDGEEWIWPDGSLMTFRKDDFNVEIIQKSSHSPFLYSASLFPIKKNVIRDLIYHDNEIWEVAAAIILHQPPNNPSTAGHACLAYFSGDQVLLYDNGEDVFNQLDARNLLVMTTLFVKGRKGL